MMWGAGQAGERHRDGASGSVSRRVQDATRLRPLPARELGPRPRALPRRRHSRQRGLAIQVEDRVSTVGPVSHQRPPVRHADLRRVLRRQAGLSEGTRRARTTVPCRSSQELPRADEAAARTSTEERLDGQTHRQPREVQRNRGTSNRGKACHSRDSR